MTFTGDQEMYGLAALWGGGGGVNWWGGSKPIYRFTREP